MNELEKYSPAVIITDNTVFKHLNALFPKAVEIIKISEGESSKNLETVYGIYDRLLKLEVDRSYYIIGIGGGLVCDITGFVAATYMRGTHCIFVPTTLLAQVDAGIGGKNGVNFKGYKNIVGTFRQPDHVIHNFQTLKTLPKKEIQNGIAEVIKSAAIADADLFEYLEKKTSQILSLQENAIEKLIHDSLNIKMNIVSSDETEKNERMKLNFGHTLGHALEKISKKYSHGEAISIGMVFAAKLSLHKGLITTQDVKRIESLIQKFGLPTSCHENKNDILDAMAKDKKRSINKIHYILLNNIGNAIIQEITFSELGEIFDDMC